MPLISPPKQANQQQQAQARQLAAYVWHWVAAAPWFGGTAALPMERERAKLLGVGWHGSSCWLLNYATAMRISHTFLFATIFSNDSLVRGRSILSGISASVFKKPVQMVSRFGPDLVQIWSRFCGPDRLDQFRQPPSDRLWIIGEKIGIFRTKNDQKPKKGGKNGHPFPSIIYPIIPIDYA